MIWTTEGTLLNAVSASLSVQSMLQGKGPCSLCCLITSSCAARGRAVVRTHAQVSVLSVCLTFGLSDMFMYRSTVIKHFSEPSLTNRAQHILHISLTCSQSKRVLQCKNIAHHRFPSKNTKVLLFISAIQWLYFKYTVNCAFSHNVGCLVLLSIYFIFGNILKGQEKPDWLEAEMMTLWSGWFSPGLMTAGCCNGNVCRSTPELPQQRWVCVLYVCVCGEASEGWMKQRAILTVGTTCTPLWEPPESCQSINI